MAARERGTVTPLSSMFPAEEARKASQRVNDTILEKQKELDNLHHFVADNTNLINLVQRLPDELHHHIMVPFGKAAFFPGRLVHTNEFLVFLGEGYYAERSAKQTVDILTRRGQTLDSQVNSAKAVIEDLKAEASFFDRTAAEAVEGLVEIREDYPDDEDSRGSQDKGDKPYDSEVSKGSSSGVGDEEEYARIMARLDELEKEELEEEDKEEDEEEDKEEDEEEENLGDDIRDEEYSNFDQEDSEVQSHATELSNRRSQLNDAYKVHCENVSVQPEKRDISSHGKDTLQKYVERSTEANYVPSAVKKSVSFKSNSEDCVPAPKPDDGNRVSRPVTDSLKAFTGSIIERTDNLQILPDKETINQPSSTRPSKPVSRFKMQRRAV